MQMTHEKTSAPVATIAGQVLGMSFARWLVWAPTHLAEVKRLAASALTQRPDRTPEGVPLIHEGKGGFTDYT